MVSLEFPVFEAIDKLGVNLGLGCSCIVCILINLHMLLVPVAQLMASYIISQTSVDSGPSFQASLLYRLHMS